MAISPDVYPILMLLIQDLLGAKYRTTLDRIKGAPDYNRRIAEERFLLIKCYEDYFLKAYKQELRRKFRKKKVTIDFCEMNSVTLTTFYRWLRSYKENDIEGLLPRYGIQNKRVSTIEQGVVSRLKKKRSRKTLHARVHIDSENPLSCLEQLRDFINKSSEIQPALKDPSIKLLNNSIALAKRKFLVPLFVPLTNDDIRQLEAYRTGTHKNHSAKATAILMANRNKHSISEIALASGRSTTTIYRWLKLFKEEGMSFVETKPAVGERGKIQQERTTRVIDILHTPPSTYNINRTSWTYDTIIKAYKELYGDHLSAGIIQRIIKKTKYTWRHARAVLTSPDPDYKKKVAKVLNTLRGAKENEAFFFIDEVGPYRVKKYGGKALTPAGVTRSVPMYQKPKGEVQAIAALEAFTNQLTWIFIEHKDTGAVITLLDIIHKKYTDKPKLYVTWDAISAHRAAAVHEWISETNKTAEAKSLGPTFQVVPLPSNSQFLNVIEGVYGGMKKAVIENSDYASKEEMQAAIARHFEERNAFFKENPKRVGNKIWDKEAFEVEELPGGLFKKM